MMGPVKVIDVNEAQKNIIKVARILELEGAIVIMGKGTSDVIF